MDVTPLTIGMELPNGATIPLIARGTAIPTSKALVASTTANNQTQIEIHLVQGEQSMAKDNRTIGRFMMEGILPAPSGVSQIECTFDIDANGILRFKAHDKGTGKEVEISIKLSAD